MWETPSIFTRELLVVGLFAASFFVPWWLVLILSLVSFFVFDWLLEVVVIGWYIDTVFNPGGMPYTTITLAVGLIVVAVIKRYR